jgi:hypothetical protein
MPIVPRHFDASMTVPWVSAWSPYDMILHYTLTMTKLLTTLVTVAVVSDADDAISQTGLIPSPISMVANTILYH